MAHLTRRGAIASLTMAIVAAMVGVSCAEAPRERKPDTSRVAAHHDGVADSTALVITRPTVIAYLVLADGAVDSLPDMAVVADDWSYAMAWLGDSVEARGLAFTLWTRSRLVIHRPDGARTDTLTLGEAGYLLVPAAGAPCVGQGAMEPAAVLDAAARVFADSGRRCPLRGTAAERGR